MIAGNPDAVEAAASSLVGPGFGDAAARVDGAATVALAGWQGRSAAAARAAFARYGPALAAGDDACHAVVAALRNYAAELRATQEVARVAPPGGPTVEAGGPVDPAVAPARDAAVERARIADERAAALIEEARGWLATMTVPAPAAVEPALPEQPSLVSGLGHTALDVAGLVPVVGEAADLVNAAWYGLEGDYVAAGLSLAAAIPIAGWLFTGGKLGMKGASTIKAVTDADGAAAWAKGRPSMVPWNAERKPYSGVGERYRWKDPATNKEVTYHGHPADPGAPAGSNSATGPTYRIQVGSHHVDADGTPYTRNQLDRRSPVYSPQAANDTHIPYPTNQPPGWDPGRRVFVPNTASLADGTGVENGSGR